MKIKFKVGKFLEALDVVNLTVDKRIGTDTKDVYILAAKKDEIERIYLYSTDFSSESIVKLDCEVLEIGGFPLNPNQLYLALSKRDPELEVTLTLNENEGNLKVGKSKFKMGSNLSQSLKHRLDAMPLKNEATVKMNAEDLINAIRKVKTCVSTDTNNTNKQILLAINLTSSGKIYTLNSTDGNTLASVKVTGEVELSDFNAMIPGEFTGTLLNLANKCKKNDTGSIDVISDNRLGFRSGDRMISVGRLSGKFPDVQSVIDRVISSKTITISKPILKDAISRVLGFGALGLKDQDHILLTLDGDSLSISTPAMADVEEIVEVTTEGDNQTTKVKISGSKLVEIVNAYTLGEVKLGFPDANGHPLLLSENIDNRIDSTYVISQLR